jgi:heat shock protein HslJ
MNRCRIILLALAVLAILVAGCSNQPASPTATPIPTSHPLPVTSPVPPTTPIQPFRGDWALATMASHEGMFPQTPTTAISLSINSSSGNLSGYGGCNNYYAPYRLAGTETPFGNGISIGPVASTKKYCEESSSFESLYLTTLGNTKAFAGDETYLTLTDDDNDKLVFNRPST